MSPVTPYSIRSPSVKRLTLYFDNEISDLVMQCGPVQALEVHGSRDCVAVAAHRHVLSGGDLRLDGVALGRLAGRDAGVQRVGPADVRPHRAVPRRGGRLEQLVAEPVRA